MLDMLGVDKGRRTWDDARVGGDRWYGRSRVAVGVGFQGVLFPPLGFEKV
jgi:hypothetical protein